MNPETSIVIEVVKVVAQGGVVAVIAFYALWNIGGKIEKLTDAVSKLHTKIAVLLDREGDHQHRKTDTETIIP